MRTGLLLALGLALGGAAPAGPTEPVAGDFNGDQRLGLEDLALLREALGGADLRYDLNGDGRVELGDFFLWADRIGSVPVVAPVDTVALPAPVDSAGAVPDSVKAPEPPPGTAVRPDSSLAAPADTAVLAALPDSPILPVDTALSPPTGLLDSSSLVLPGFPAPADSAAPPVFPPPSPPLPPAYYSFASTPKTTSVWLTQYHIAIHNTPPFGIASLRLQGQPVDFAHPELPLGDWEWFWFVEPGQPQGRAAIKLLEADWDPPQVERRADEVVVRFRRPDTLRRGVELEVAYRLDARRPGFAVEYKITNSSNRFLANPYAMVGFPGFANQQWVVAVAHALSARTPAAPFANFRDEALGLGKADYLLLRQDLDLSGQEEGTLSSKVSLRRAGRTYTVETILMSTSGLSHVYMAHTNKPRYLTSHLYAFLRSMAPGQSRSVAVRYLLSEEAAATGVAR